MIPAAVLCVFVPRRYVFFPPFSAGLFYQSFDAVQVDLGRTNLGEEKYVIGSSNRGHSRQSDRAG